MQTMQGLAVALTSAGQTEEALAAYQQAGLRAAQLGDPALRSQLRRNFGLLLSELHRDAEAEVELRGAVEDARNSEGDMLSRAQIALGIFFQHRQRLDEARPLLTAALPCIDPAHSDAVVGRAHLRALETGKSCGCDDQPEALAEAFQEFVLAQFPEGFLERFEVRLENNDFQIQVHLNHEPTQDELEHLNRVITHALAEFRKRLGRRD
jgi:hypothetical protein